HQPGDRRRVRGAARAKRLRQLGKGGAAPAGEAAADRAARRAATARGHDGLCQHRHQAHASVGASIRWWPRGRGKPADGSRYDEV
ncbi:hypothetical protein KXV85_002777, partial [Aspergillus fumigatus]